VPVETPKMALFFQTGAISAVSPGSRIRLTFEFVPAAASASTPSEMGKSAGAHAVKFRAPSVRYTNPLATTGLSQWIAPTDVVSDQSAAPVTGERARRTPEPAS
jgi:hypothetical protein